MVYWRVAALYGANMFSLTLMSNGVLPQSLVKQTPCPWRGFGDKTSRKLKQTSKNESHWVLMILLIKGKVSVLTFTGCFT